MKIFKIIWCEGLVIIFYLFRIDEEMQSEAKEQKEMRSEAKDQKNAGSDEEIRVYRPKLNKRLCIGCGDCVIACPINKRADISINKERTILSVRNGLLYIENIQLCDGCGICVEACFPKAISIEFPIQEAK